jgi:predicted secreted acid phosphatase
MNKDKENEDKNEEEKEAKIDVNDQAFGKPFVLIHLGI